MTAIQLASSSPAMKSSENIASVIEILQVISLKWPKMALPYIFQTGSKLGFAHLSGNRALKKSRGIFFDYLSSWLNLGKVCSDF